MSQKRRLKRARAPKAAATAAVKELTGALTQLQGSAETFTGLSELVAAWPQFVELVQVMVGDLERVNAENQLLKRALKDLLLHLLEKEEDQHLRYLVSLLPPDEPVEGSETD